MASTGHKYQIGHPVYAGSEKGWFKKGVSINVESMHPHWKGEDASYSSIHKWVKRKKGSAKLYKCIDCGIQKPWMHWSNVSHLYKRDLSDYEPRCVNCHKIYDNK